VSIRLVRRSEDLAKRYVVFLRSFPRTMGRRASLESFLFSPDSLFPSFNLSFGVNSVILYRLRTSPYHWKLILFPVKTRVPLQEWDCHARLPPPAR
jgi:hypothetical protein